MLGGVLGLEFGLISECEGGPREVPVGVDRRPTGSPELDGGTIVGGGCLGLGLEGAKPNPLVVGIDLGSPITILLRDNPFVY